MISIVLEERQTPLRRRRVTLTGDIRNGRLASIRLILSGLGRTEHRGNYTDLRAAVLKRDEVLTEAAADELLDVPCGR